MKPNDFKQIRHSLGLSLSQMGAALGVEERTIRRYEDGTRAIGMPVQILIRYILKHGTINGGKEK